MRVIEEAWSSWWGRRTKQNSIIDHADSYLQEKACINMEQGHYGSWHTRTPTIMRRFIVTRLYVSASRPRASSFTRHLHYRGGGFDFSSSPRTVSDTAAPWQDNGLRMIIRPLMQLQNIRFFTSTQANPLNTRTRIYCILKSLCWSIRYMNKPKKTLYDLEDIMKDQIPSTKEIFVKCWRQFVLLTRN
ncbi:hypothetical protein LXL04_034522 [Taraxacum kok-saghyz]